MRRLTQALCLFLALALPAAADIQDEYWPKLLSGDFEALEADLDALHDRVRAGEVSYDEQRKVYALFETTHPDVEKMVESWRQALPQSRHAKAAQMWRLFRISWIYRGQGTVRETHPAAMARFQEYSLRAFDLAQDLLESHPDFVPGTDGIALLLRGPAPLSMGRSYLRRIFDHTPNWGTLHRALPAFLPRWGGSEADILSVCNEFAPEIGDPDAAEICAAEQILWWQTRDEELQAFAVGVAEKHLERMTWEARLLYAYSFTNNEKTAFDAILESGPGYPHYGYYANEVIKDPDLLQTLESREADRVLLSFERDPQRPRNVLGYIRIRHDQIEEAHAQKRAALRSERADVVARLDALRRDQNSDDTALVEELIDVNRRSRDFGAKVRAEQQDLTAEILPKAYRFGTFHAGVWTKRAGLEYLSRLSGSNSAKDYLRSIKAVVSASLYRGTSIGSYWDSLKDVMRPVFYEAEALDKAGNWRAEYDLEIIKQVFACDMVEVGRLQLTICEDAGTGSEYCRLEEYFVSEMRTMLSQSERLGLCPDAFTKPLSEVVEGLEAHFLSLQ